MLALGVGDDSTEEKKKEICRECLTQAKATEELKLWQTRWLKRGEDLKCPTSWQSTKLGRFSAYELLLEKKKENIPRSGPFLKAWKERYKRLSSLYPQAKAILSEKTYDVILCYNSLYGIHNMFSCLAKKSKVPFLSLSHSFNFSKENEFILIRGQTFNFLEMLRKKYNSEKPLSTKEKKSIKAHSKALLAGNKPWNYSAPLGVKPVKEGAVSYDKKVLVCLSSPDENVAAEFIGAMGKNQKHAFRNQIDWIRWIRTMATKERQILFWIRPHPRLFPNKREKQESQLSRLLQEERKKTAPPNFFWPEQSDQGSLWSHLGNTDIVFNAWSSIADEFGQKGIPVMTFFPDYSNSGRVVDITSKKIEGYESLFREALQVNSSNEMKKRYSRWLGDYLCTSTFVLNLKPGKMQKLYAKVLRWTGIKNQSICMIFEPKNRKQDLEIIKNILKTNINSKKAHNSRT
jgi:hypothetical protein